MTLVPRRPAAEICKGLNMILSFVLIGLHVEYYILQGQVGWTVLRKALSGENDFLASRCPLLSPTTAIPWDCGFKICNSRLFCRPPPPLQIELNHETPNGHIPKRAGCTCVSHCLCLFLSSRPATYLLTPSPRTSNARRAGGTIFKKSHLRAEFLAGLVVFMIMVRPRLG